MWTLIDSPLSSALLEEARLGSGWLEDRSARLGSAPVRLYPRSNQLILAQLGLFGSAPNRCSAWFRARFQARDTGLGSILLVARLGLFEARVSSRLGASHLGSARYSGLGASRLVTRVRLRIRGCSAWLSLMFRLAQLRARLGVQLGAQLGIGWGIGIRFGLAQGSARLTCLGLVLGIGSGLGLTWKPGPSRCSTNIHLHPQCHFQSFTHAVNLFYFVRTFFTSPRFFFLKREVSSSACSLTVDCWGFSRSLLRVPSHWVERIPPSQHVSGGPEIS